MFIIILSRFLSIANVFLDSLDLIFTRFLFFDNFFIIIFVSITVIFLFIAHGILNTLNLLPNLIVLSRTFGSRDKLRPALEV